MFAPSRVRDPEEPKQMKIVLLIVLHILPPVHC